MFKRPHHQRISEILERLNHELLMEHHCFFGGGTAIALLYEEYRESVDIDFLISDLEHYRALRDLLTGPDGIGSITHKNMKLALAREIRADQYGIRTVIQMGDVRVKFEIVLEGRISFEMPKDKDRVGEIATLSRGDLMASKLLANSDRWNDGSVFSRDIIDLAMLDSKKDELQKALQKSQLAYGDSICRDLQKAVERLLTREHELEKCMEALQMNVPRALLWQRLNDLRSNELVVRPKDQ